MYWVCLFCCHPPQSSTLDKKVPSYIHQDTEAQKWTWNFQNSQNVYSATIGSGCKTKEPLLSYWPSILDFEPNFLRPLTIRHFWAVLPPILNVIFGKIKSGGSIPVAEYRPHYVDLLRCQLPRHLPGSYASLPAVYVSPNIVPLVFDHHRQRRG